MRLSLLLALGLASTTLAKKPIVYLIRHGEKPASGDGLSPQGVARSQCLRTVFGANSTFDIGYIMAQTPQSDGTQQRPFDTVKPLAGTLGLNVDISCSKKDSKCVQKVVNSYNGKGNILICWEHHELTNLVTALGASNAPLYPDTSFDIIWTDPSPYSAITDNTLEHCPGVMRRSTPWHA